MKTLKAREKRRAAKAKELERKEGSSRREGSDRRKRDGSLRKDGANTHDGDGSLLRRESSRRKDGVRREGSSSRRHGSREKRERTSSREHRKHGAEASAQVCCGKMQSYYRLIANAFGVLVIMEPINITAIGDMKFVMCRGIIALFASILLVGNIVNLVA